MYTSYLYSGVSDGQVVQAIALLRIVIAVEILQQDYSFPNVRRIFAPHKAPGVFELCFLRNERRRVQLLMVHSLEFLKRKSRQLSQGDATSVHFGSHIAIGASSLVPECQINYASFVQWKRA